jgi:ferric-dicitrate binding protein FerR (iron transport regulator)
MDDYQKYIEDRRFIRWVFDPDPETEAYYAGYLQAHPEEEKEVLGAKRALRLLAVRKEKAGPGRKESIYQEIISGGSGQNIPGKHSILPGAFVRYAAVALIFFAIGSLTVSLLEKSRTEMLADESMLVKSASLNTMVYLADGSQREIGNAGALIDFSAPGFLMIGAEAVPIGNALSAHSKNLVVVPYGKRARVKLYDQSVVSLSAGSRIILPAAFSADSRNAYLVGEAFFDVTRDPSRPFFIRTSLSEMKVLGTSFNFCAYPDRKEQTAFLQSGKILFSEQREGLFQTWNELRPGEQLTLNTETNDISVTAGNEQYYALWKDGIVQLDQVTVHDLLIRVGHYFNITLRASDDHRDLSRITGKLDLNADQSEVFKYIENITDGNIIKINEGAFMLE